MVLNENSWLDYKAVSLMKEVGLQKGDRIIDFGCRDGNFTIPAARIAGEKGKVYAIEKDEYFLNKVREAAKKESLNNIIFIKNRGDNFKFDIKEGTIDIILLYDVLHYMTEIDRSTIYEDSYRVLKKDGLLSIYPKHYKYDWPMQTLADVGLDQIIEEVKKSNFVLDSVIEKEIMHFHTIEKGKVFNFKK
jgi:ubiquinone/menaquinone biosynthesis C-methylase UbiE